MVKRYFDAEADVKNIRVYAAVPRSPNLLAVLASDYIRTDNNECDQFPLFSFDFVEHWA